MLTHLIKVLGIGVFVLLALGSATPAQNNAVYTAPAPAQRNCWFAVSQAYADPGRTGNFGEAQMRANAAYDRCMNGG